jgi:uncharacterized integral membrane protein
MPWKLIGFIAICIVFVVFSGLNVQKIQVSFGIVTLSDVPLFVTLIVSFILGSIITIPFVMVSNKRRTKKGNSRRDAKKEAPSDSRQKTHEKDRQIADKIKDE